MRIIHITKDALEARSGLCLLQAFLSAVFFLFLILLCRTGVSVAADVAGLVEPASALAVASTNASRAAGQTANATTPAATQGAAPASVRKPPVEPYPVLQVPPLAWMALPGGMELGTAVLAESKENNRDAYFVVLRFSPDQQKFSLHMASHSDKAHSPVDWGTGADLVAGINASMYLPDNITSTGYMRDGDKVNNDKMGGRLGAFFVSGGRVPGIPKVDILEREGNWREMLEKYSIVVQNYRLVSSKGKILWPEGGQEKSIAAVAKDNKGRIVFVLCQEPLSAVRFALYLKSFPLGITSVMYVEGGVQSGLFVRLDDKASKKLPGGQLPGAAVVKEKGGNAYVWRGRQSLLNLKGNPHATLPNIIGVSR